MASRSHVVAVPAFRPAAHDETLLDRYLRLRRRTEMLVAPLDPEDMVVQSMPDASPVKWHLAHTTWFFETFLLSAGLPSVRSELWLPLQFLLRGARAAPAASATWTSHPSRD